MKIESFEELVHRADEASGQADTLLNSIKADEVRLQENGSEPFLLHRVFFFGSST